MKFYENLTTQHHILIAGATGSGKSVVINGLMAETLKSYCRYILIDPKRVELIEYKGLPQVIRYASEPEDMYNALQYAVELMDARYSYMQDECKKDYDGNKVYIIIDELADLMLTQGKRVAPLIQRLCQLGRAAKISVVAATQCPLAVVIPTTIKVNFTATVALHTANAQHSRNIMECSGCERLPKYGEAFYLTPDGTEHIKVPMVPGEERMALVRRWTAPKAAPQAPKAQAPKAPAKAPEKAPAKPHKRGLFGWVFA